jgi:alkylhydroperoxidase family enzyme
VKLTAAPASVGREDADKLRALGVDDGAIHDAIQVIAYFNYINRIAEAVGTEDEPEWASREPEG